MRLFVEMPVSRFALAQRFCCQTSIVSKELELIDVVVVEQNCFGRFGKLDVLQN